MLGCPCRPLAIGDGTIGLVACRGQGVSRSQGKEQRRATHSYSLLFFPTRLHHDVGDSLEGLRCPTGAPPIATAYIARLGLRRAAYVVAVIRGQSEPLSPILKTLAALFRRRLAVPSPVRESALVILLVFTGTLRPGIAGGLQHCIGAQSVSADQWEHGTTVIACFHHGFEWLTGNAAPPGQ